MELGLAWSRWKCFRDIKVRAFFNLAEHTLRKRDGPIPEDWPALQSPLLPVPFSLHVTPRNSSLSIDRWNHRKCERISHPHFFFLFLSFFGEGRAKKNAKLVTIANHGLDSNPCRLRMEGVLNGYKTTDVEFFASKSPLAVLAAASHSSSFPFSLSLPSPSSLERTASTKLDKLGWGKVSRGGTTRENFIPSGVTVGTRFRSKGMDFRISDPEWLSIFPWNRAQLSRPCAKEEREGKARGGIIKIFHRCSISLRPGGAASKNTESKYFEKIGSSEIRKSGPERNSCWGERIARKRQREGEGGRENSGENGAWRRVSAFIESRKKSLEIGPISATSLCDGSIELKFVEEKAKALRIIRFVLIFRFAFRLQPLFIFFPSLLLSLFSFFPVSFFFLPFLLPRRARRERERIRNWVGEEANHAEKMKYRGKLRVRGKTQTRA